MNVIRIGTIVSLLFWPIPTATPLAQVSEHLQQSSVDREVRITLTVSDAQGRPVDGLLRESFSVLEKKTPDEITFFSTENPPISIALLFDLSGSMRQTKTARVAEAINKFARQSNNSNHYLVAGFNTRTQLFSDWCSGNILQAAWDGILKYTPTSNTALYDACDLVVRKMQSAPDRRRVIVIIGDGEDNNSKVTFKELSLRLGQSDVMVYAVGLQNGSGPGSTLGLEGQGILAHLASVTGGKAFFPRSAAELDEICGNLALELVHQYVIGFTASNPPDSKLHEIKIKLTPPSQAPANKPPHVSVRYRPTYFNQ